MDTIKAYWKKNRLHSYIIIAAVLLILAHFGIFSIKITIGSMSLSLGNP
jgi:uncharacterized membrane protein YqjE